MATSGSTNFAVTRDDIINEALELLGVLSEGESANADQITSASRTLNMMTKAWQADGLNLFAVERMYLFTEKTQEEYSLSSTTTDHVTTDFVETTVSVAATAGASTITVTSATGILDGDQIGIASGTDVQWTTVNGTPAANVITLTDTLDADADVNAVVYAFTTTADRPMKIMEAYIHLAGSNTDIPIGKISRRYYNQLSVKDNVGIVNQFYYDPQVSAGQLFVWPTTDDEKNYIVMFVQRTLDDLDAGTDNPDFPQEWYLPLALNLAVLLATKFGVPATEYREIASQAQGYYEMARGFDEELYTSVYLTPDQRGEDL